MILRWLSTQKPVEWSLLKLTTWSNLLVVQRRSMYAKWLLVRTTLFDLLVLESTLSFDQINLHLPSDFLLASLFANISCRSRSFAAACCSSSLRTATRVGDRAGERDLEAPDSEEVSNGLDKPCVASSAICFPGDFLGDFLGVCRPLLLLGELRAPLWGGIALGGDKAIVGFRIDLT